MLKEKLSLIIPLICLLMISSCSQDPEIKEEGENKSEQSEQEAANYDEQHPYGGWFCPDNLNGFPPVDISNLDLVPVVNDRLPTLEETRNGTSLLYFDEEKYPNAKPLDMEFPRVAEVFSGHNGMNELIIVIQAAVIEKDTVVGFRYPTGGNGSAWFGQVRFLSDKEVEDLGNTPYVYLDSEIKSTKAKIWKAIAKTTYAKKLGERFDKKEFFASEWSDESTAYMNLDSDSVKAAGIITNMWGNLYMHVDYDYNGFHFAEKMLVMEDSENNTAQLQVVSGPYPEDFTAQKVMWENWLEEVITLSEKK